MQNFAFKQLRTPPHVLAAIVTILIANAMGWIDTGEIIEKFERFQEYKMAVAGAFIA